MNYPLDKYKYFIHHCKDGRIEIIAISTFAGKQVRGIAHYNPNDKFDIEIGKKLAALKCNQKIELKRHKRAIKCLNKANRLFENANRYREKMRKYYEDTLCRVDNANIELDACLKNLT